MLFSVVLSVIMYRNLLKRNTKKNIEKVTRQTAVAVNVKKTVTH